MQQSRQLFLVRLDGVAAAGFAPSSPINVNGRVNVTVLLFVRMAIGSSARQSRVGPDAVVADVKLWPFPPGQ